MNTKRNALVCAMLLAVFMGVMFAPLFYMIKPAQAAEVVAVGPTVGKVVAKMGACTVYTAQIQNSPMSTPTNMFVIQGEANHTCALTIVQ